MCTWQAHPCQQLWPYEWLHKELGRHSDIKYYYDNTGKEKTFQDGR